MKRLSTKKLADTVASKRKEQGLSQQAVADKTKINRAIISRIENDDFIPSIEQLEALGEALGFEVVDMFVEEKPQTEEIEVGSKKICVAGSGYYKTPTPSTNIGKTGLFVA